MSYLFKFFWVARSLLYRCFMGAFGFPGYMGPPTFMLGLRRMTMGRRVRIFPGLRAECHGQGELVIEDDVALGQSVHITCGERLVIGQGTVIAGFVSITDIDHDYQEVGVPVMSQGHTTKETRIGRNCFIGMGVRIQPGTRLGDGCVVGANSVVRGEYPANSVIVGSPARVVRSYDPGQQAWVRTVNH
ncbi:acyltransferase [Stenotrophomonas sp. HMWF023]|jgi:acetyltransferase-like isoleucine patch superfamily enzyme|uniref:acyltransferase n=1 Tax=Stenotrophomonas sp. HMWF023 TaxID=2056859 RepID=UPI000D33A99F|nr:acyltransferase [Stenotrophomonas sp. HMWF023]PTS72527.1 lipopolysaccharide biosynthesis protein [Stenotrophomonas sp. HMWF023]